MSLRMPFPRPSHLAPKNVGFLFSVSSWLMAWGDSWTWVARWRSAANHRFQFFKPDMRCSTFGTLRFCFGGATERAKSILILCEPRECWSLWMNPTSSAQCGHSVDN